MLNPSNGFRGNSGPALVRAVEYVRMSTEHQQYSTDNQSAAILEYAARRGYQLVHRYADEGRSGLRVKGRPALKRLLADIESGRNDFSAVLVYDVSRWGRFQDPDEAASIELRCRQAGVAVHYCAEQFENDGSIGSSIIKTVKRAMAGEFSRELSSKVYLGQARVVSLGYLAGGTAGYGLRRQLLDRSGEIRGALGMGESKAVATDRVTIVPGPANEVQVVREIYERFVRGGLSEKQIAALLNQRGVTNQFDRPWNRTSIKRVLSDERYIGNNVWARRSYKLKQRSCTNSPSTWVRRNHAFEPILDEPTFHSAQEKMRSRRKSLSSEQLLDKLREIHAKVGSLSAEIIDSYGGAPRSKVYAARFGGLLEAYRRVGFILPSKLRHFQTRAAIRTTKDRIYKEISAAFVSDEGLLHSEPASRTFVVGDGIRISVEPLKCVISNSGSCSWRVRPGHITPADIVILARLNSSNSEVRDVYIIPYSQIPAAMFSLQESNEIELDAFSRCGIAELVQKLTRMSIRRTQ